MSGLGKAGTQDPLSRSGSFIEAWGRVCHEGEAQAGGAELEPYPPLCFMPGTSIPRPPGCPARASHGAFLCRQLWPLTPCYLHLHSAVSVPRAGGALSVGGAPLHERTPLPELGGTRRLPVALALSRPHLSTSRTTSHPTPQAFPNPVGSMASAQPGTHVAGQLYLWDTHTCARQVAARAWAEAGNMHVAEESRKSQRAGAWQKPESWAPRVTGSRRHRTERDSPEESTGQCRPGQHAQTLRDKTRERPGHRSSWGLQ